MLEYKIDELIKLVEERFNKVDRALERLSRVKDALDGDRLLDNQDLCQLLGVTKRTLRYYRQKKLISYYQINGKTFYKASEIEGFLKRKGRMV